MGSRHSLRIMKFFFPPTPGILFSLCTILLLTPLMVAEESEPAEDPYATSIEPRGEDEREMPIRLGTFQTDAKHLSLRWNLSTEKELSGFIIQTGTVKNTTETTREFEWTGLIGLSEGVTQWPLETPENATWFRIVGVPKEPGEAPVSAPVLFFPQSVPAPTAVRVSADRVEDRSIQFSWSPPVGSDSLPTMIERARYSSGPWQQLGSVPAGGRIYRDRFLEPNTEYFYRVSGTINGIPWTSDPLRVRTER